MNAAPVSARDRLLALLRTAAQDGTWVKLTLGKYRGNDPTVRNLFVRPVTLKAGPHLTFVWRHTLRDVTKNYPPAEALAALETLIGRDFLDAHLFTLTQAAQLECNVDGTARLSLKTTAAAPARPVASSAGPAPASTPATAAAATDSSSGGPGHDRTKHRLLAADTPWLRALGVLNDRGQPREGMAAKYRQIQKFVELLAALAREARLDESAAGKPLQVADMGSGKGYLTFATSSYFGASAEVNGIESRSELVALCNRVARETGMRSLTFTSGEIAATAVGSLDVLIALHACDTATDDALAAGINAGARLLLVSPCCQKELRPQLTAPPVLADALRHGIFQERQAEFVTDALRAMLLEWAGYRSRVAEFISTEHTARNLMIAAVKAPSTALPDPELTARIQGFATFYGIKHQRLAQHLGFPLDP